MSSEYGGAGRLQSSGHVLADKRYAYAEALLRDGDALAAADLCAQAAEQAPDWSPLYLTQGLAFEQAGRPADAVAAFRRAAERDPSGVLGAALHLARLEGQRLEGMPHSYVAALFDQYAPRFDAHLLQDLGYCGPAVIMSALEKSAAPRFGVALDLGCGTGLMARALATKGGIIDGIDLSSAMVVEARATGLYRALHVGECATVGQRLPPASYDLVVAADVLVYLGDLSPLAVTVARLLVPGGVFAGTLQAGETDYDLGSDLRFRHGTAYLRRTLAAAGFAAPLIEPCVTRQEAGRDVPGLVFVTRRA